MLIGIDGPGGSGKSTVARVLACALGLQVLDTGAMYRAVALLSLTTGTSSDDGAALAKLAEQMDLVVVDGERYLLDGRDVTGELRGKEVEAVVSQVAAHKGVRAELVRRQRAWAKTHGGGVVEGRDITSVVFPDADLRVYLTASHEARTHRRSAQVAKPFLSEPQGEVTGAKTITGGEIGDEAVVDKSDIGRAIANRDASDLGREVSPLVVAEGAIVIDSTNRAVDEIVHELVQHLEKGKAELGPNKKEQFLYSIAWYVLAGSGLLMFPGVVEGQENLPARGAYILAPVHRSNVDWMIAARVTHRRLRFVIKEEVWKVKIAGKMLEALGSFSVKRGATDREAFETALLALSSGEPLVVFPEGTRKQGPIVEELRDGAAYLALRANVPIVPVGLGGTDKAMPRGARLPRPHKVRVVVGKPLRPGDFVGGDQVETSGAEVKNRRVSRVVTKNLSSALRDALQQVYDEASVPK